MAGLNPLVLAQEQTPQQVARRLSNRLAVSSVVLGNTVTTSCFTGFAWRLASTAPRSGQKSVAMS